MENEIAIKCEDVVKVYRIKKAEVRALRGIDIEIKKGEFTVIMGPSGCGKTTLFNLIGALDKPTAGSIYLDGLEMSRLSEGTIANVRLKKVGIIFQFYNLISTLTALENVSFPLLLSGIDRRTRMERAEELLKQVGLENRLEHFPSELSGGERRRAAIARALINNPEIILADEPTADLDTENGKGIIELLAKINRDGRTVVISTHDPFISEKADRVIKMRDGKVVGV